jgi:hypothetical protein
MNFLVKQMKWVMLISGLLTFTMIYAAFAPQASLQSTFGEALTGPVADIVVRNWGALIALIGAMLLYGAFNVASRPLVLTVAGVSKIVFIGLILASEQRLIDKAIVPIAIDSLMIVLFALYLIASRNRTT